MHIALWCQGPPASTLQTHSRKAITGITLTHHRQTHRQTFHPQCHVLKCACATPAPGEASPSVFPWVILFKKWLKLLVSGEKMSERMFLMLKNLSNLYGCFTNKPSKGILPAPRKAGKSCLENEAVNSLFKWKQTAEHRKKKSQVSIGRPIYSKIYLYWKKICQSSKVRVFKCDFQ